MEIMEHCEKKRKFDHIGSASIGSILDTMGERMEVGWHTLQPILENDVLHAKIPSTEVAFGLLSRWFTIIVHDQEKLRVFRQWILPSPEVTKQENDAELSECVVPASSCSPASCASSSCSSGSSSSFSSPASTSISIALAAENLKNSGTIIGNLKTSGHIAESLKSSSESLRTSGAYEEARFSPDISRLSPSNDASHQVLLQLLQQQQQQIVLLQQLQNPSSQQIANPSTITLSSKFGSPDTLITVSLQDKTKWHAHSPNCECSLGFTLTDGFTTSAQRTGGSEGELVFIIPNLPCNNANGAPVVVHLTMCDAREFPIVCLEPFVYIPRRGSLGSSMGSDQDDSEEANDETPDDDERDEDAGPPRALPPSGIANCPTPKQLMTIRERMLEHIKRTTKGSARIIVQQQPSVSVVWKNRRLDTPFKLRVEGLEDTAAINNGAPLAASKLIALAIVADHKGRLQIDAVENYVEDFNVQGLSHFANLRMTKGTWGKEWTITFAAIVKSSFNNATVVAVSPSCPIVVKTRKNPQIRHNSSSRSSELFSAPPTPPPITFVERRFETSGPRLKRHRVEDLLNHRPSSPLSLPPSSHSHSHSEDMASLLYAAELKQQEMDGMNPSPSPLALPSQGGDADVSDKDFVNFQSLVTYLEDIRSKQQVSLSITEQPLPKRDSKVLIVKKGKPFRIPFRVQLRSTAAKHNPQNYVCVAVVKNDKGEEVAVRNNEVPFDWRGTACFAGLMVMKGTWGKTVQLTFETRWSSKRLEKTPPWSTARMLVVCETSPIQLMCYTKDKKGPGGP